MFKMSTSGHNSCTQPKSSPISRLINEIIADYWSNFCFWQRGSCL